jgi:hypothetical protein
MHVENGDENVLNQPQAEKRDSATDHEVARLLGRAEKGDVTVLPQLRRLLDESPQLWRDYGDLAAQAQANWVQLAAGINLLLAESLSRKAAELRSELAGPSPSPLEKLLAERVVACWLQVSFYDSQVAQIREYKPAQGRMLQQQLDSANRRYQAAIKTLARVRKLLTPARSPVEIATKLAGERSGLRLRQAPVEAGVPVEN